MLKRHQVSHGERPAPAGVSRAKVFGAIKAATLAIWLCVVLASSLFAGLLIATAGGAVYTPLYKVAAPFACDGEFTVESRRHSSRPGQYKVSHNIFCKDGATGARAEITLYAIFVAFLVYSGLTFAALVVLTLVLVVALRLLARRLRPEGLGGLLPDPVLPPPGARSARKM